MALDLNLTLFPHQIDFLSDTTTREIALVGDSTAVKADYRSVLLAAALGLTQSVDVGLLGRNREIASAIFLQTVVAASIRRHREVESAIALALATGSGGVEVRRSRAVAAAAAATLAAATSSLLRNREVSASIEQTLTMLVDVAAAGAIALSASIDYTLAAGASVTRVRGLSALITELEAQTATLLRARTITGSITELQAVNAKILRTLNVVAGLAQSTNVVARLARSRSIEVLIEQGYTTEDIELLVGRIVALAATINQSLSSEVGGVARLRKVGTPAALRAVEILDVILRDEIGHVAVGNRWYGWLCAQQRIEPLSHYRRLAREHSAPRLKPPFNEAARRAAGFSQPELDALTQV